MDPARPLPVDGRRPRRLLAPDGRVVREPQIHDPELDALRAADRERDEALAFWNPATKHRLAVYVAGSMAFFPLSTWFVTPAGWGALWFQLLVAAAYGAYVALARPGMALCALATVFAGVLIQAYIGTTQGTKGTFLVLLALVLYFAAGAVLGFREQDRQGDR